MADILTERCKLIPLAFTDRSDIARLYRSEEVRRFLGGVVSDEKFEASFAGTMKSFVESGERQKTSWVIRLKETGDFFGLIIIHKHHDGDEFEISYQLLPMFWKRGLARETVGAAIDYARDTLGLSRLLAETQAANTRSRSLLEKLGFTQQRTLTRFGAEQVIYERLLP